MELDSNLFCNKHLDHGTFHNNFMKIPYEYLIRLLREIARLLEKLLGYYLITIFDSTGLNTRLYEETMIKGKIKKRNKDYKLHTITAYHPKEKITYYIDALSSDKHISDAEGAKRLLQRNKTNGYHLGDKAYDCEKVYKEILTKEGIPIIKPKKHKAKLFTCKSKGRSMYKEHIYKELRGVIETSYGGLENKGLINTRCIRDDSIKKKGILAAIRHSFITYLRVLANQINYFIELLDKLNETIRFKSILSINFKMKDPLSKELFDSLACPICKSNLKYNHKKTALICTKCHKIYKIKENIPILLP
jgi:uncharacterized protein YbaR (Trm112 family)